jgi:hypothetical protein
MCVTIDILHFGYGHFNLASKSFKLDSGDEAQNGRTKSGRKHMKANIILAGITAFAGSLFPFTSQAGDAAQGLPGFLNPSTGVFTSRPVLTPAAAAISATATITISFTVKINTAIPIAQTITCSGTISSFDSSFSNSAFGQSNVVKSSATAGTCTITIPYIWQIAAATTMMNVSASIATSNGFSVGSVSRNASATVAPFAVPVKGTKSVAVTLAL